MADQSGAQWLDLLEEDIPVVDKTGKQLLVKGLDFVDAAAAPAPAAAAPVPAPVAPAPAPAAPAHLDIGQPAAPAAPVLEKAPTVTRADLGLDADKDLADLKKIEALVAKKEMSVETKAESNLLDTMVDQAAAEKGASLPDDDMRRRYRMLISLFFRDLRDGLETKSKFTMPVMSGGMGMTDDEAELVMTGLARKNDEYHAALKGKAVDDKAKYVAERTEKVLGAQDALDKNDNARMEQAFTGLMQRTGVTAPGAPATAPAAPAPAKEPKIVLVVGLDSKGQAMPAAAPAAVPAPAPAPAAPAPMPGSSLPAKPAVSDVKFSPRLTGPVEELRSISLKDFRRLSRDPKEATLKLKDKIDLLEDQSFDIKTQGIKAWQDSEVNKLYLDILRKSLEGKPITEVIADLENKALPSLSKAEFDSIMELNRKLRFG